MIELETVTHLMVKERAEKLEAALEGIAACATQCVCCEMHRQIAEKALGYPVEVTTSI